MGVTYTTATGATYVPIATYTFASAAANYTFTNIPSSYTDLRLVMWQANGGGGNGGSMQFNSDTAANYSNTILYGNPTAGVNSARNTSVTEDGIGGGVSNSMWIIDIFSYANTNVYKSILNRNKSIVSLIESLFAEVGLWRSTAAINSIKINAATTFGIGTTMSLYGILGA